MSEVMGSEKGIILPELDAECLSFIEAQANVDPDTRSRRTANSIRTCRERQLLASLEREAALEAKLSAAENKSEWISDKRVLKLYKERAEAAESALAAAQAYQLKRENEQSALDASTVEERFALRELLSALVGKLEAVQADDSYQSVWVCYMIHGGQYVGPTYADELIAAQEYLKEKASVTPSDKEKV